MATEVNGNHAPYAGLEHQQNNRAYSANGSSTSQATVTHPPPASSTPAAATTESKPDVSKDEVGWAFVEQYYTTLSRSPDKLHLFYSKRSQYVSGQETDKVSVCVGQRAIHDRIKTLDFHDCKVRVTNVDSQASDSNIVIQVIGEISNRSQPHKKFTQTFVLAPQPQGFFVLNDIFRYLVEEEDEPEQAVETGVENVENPPAVGSGYLEPIPTANHTANHTPPEKTLTSSASPAAVERDAQQVDEEIKSKVPEQVTESAEPKVNGHAAEEEEEEVDDAEEAEDEPAAASLPTPPTEQEPAATEEVTPAPAVEEPQQEKEVAEPAPTPSPPKQATPQPAPAPKPAAPKTWASLAASANRVATPAAPSSSSSATSQAKPAPKPTAAPSNTLAAPTPQAAPSAPAAQREASPAEASQGDEWTAVGGSHNRNQSRQTNVTQQPEGPQYRGYIKNVHEGVDGNALKAHLETFGEVTYFDIARQKVSQHNNAVSARQPALTDAFQNCAFVDFKTHEGYKGAVDSGSFTISDESLYLEERKFRPGATPYIPRGRGRGGPGQGTPRGGYQGRGGYAPRGGRGGGPGGAPRGRGSSVAT